LGNTRQRPRKREVKKRTRKKIKFVKYAAKRKILEEEKKEAEHN
jgi:hypothetical protein